MFHSSGQKPSESGVETVHNGKHHEQEESDLARIDFAGNNPFDLFKEWHAEAREFHPTNPDYLCFSTASKEGIPSSRHLLLRRLEDDGFVIMTDGRSRKAHELAENPHASIAFLWSYYREGQAVNRQVRIDGHVEPLPQSACQEIWEREPLFCKIRANICDQGHPVDWEEHKEKHDRLYNDVHTNQYVPPLPSHVAFYKVIPTFVDFYYAYDKCIGDRLAFHSVGKDATVWKKDRIAA